MVPADVSCMDPVSNDPITRPLLLLCVSLSVCLLDDLWLSLQDLDVEMWPSTRVYFQYPLNTKSYLLPPGIMSSGFVTSQVDWTGTEYWHFKVTLYLTVIPTGTMKALLQLKNWTLKTRTFNISTSNKRIFPLSRSAVCDNTQASRLSSIFQSFLRHSFRRRRVRSPAHGHMCIHRWWPASCA